MIRNGADAPPSPAPSFRRGGRFSISLYNARISTDYPLKQIGEDEIPPSYLLAPMMEPKDSDNELDQGIRHETERIAVHNRRHVGGRGLGKLMFRDIHLKHMRLYHGSDQPVREPKILHSKRTMDFGEGFYTTQSEQQATEWTMSVSRRRGSIEQYVT